jgi:excisionase family DNA binding protein
MPMIKVVSGFGAGGASGALSGALLSGFGTTPDGSGELPAHEAPMSSDATTDPAVLLARITADLARLGQSIAAARLAPPPAAPPRPRLLHTVEEAGERLSLSRSAVYELIREGEILSVKVGGRRRITQSALDAYVAGLAPDDPRAAAS